MRAPTRLTAILITAAWLCGIGPCGPVPGGRLDGPLVEEEPADWSFADDYERCQLEVRPAAPHSVNASCYTHEGRLYVGSFKSHLKRWPRYLMDDPRVRVRIGGRIFALRAVPILEPVQRNAVGRSRAQQSGAEPGPDYRVPDDYGIWRLDRRR